MTVRSTMPKQHLRDSTACSPTSSSGSCFRGLREEVGGAQAALDGKSGTPLRAQTPQKHDHNYEWGRRLVCHPLSQSDTCMQANSATEPPRERKREREREKRPRANTTNHDQQPPERRTTKNKKNKRGRKPWCRWRPRSADRSGRSWPQKHKGKPKPKRFGFPQHLRERERENTASTKKPDKEKNEGDRQLDNKHGSGREGLKRTKTNTDP